MNKRQKKILRDILTVVIVTFLAVVGMINFKDWNNRNEAKRAMEDLGQRVLQYRQENGHVPPQSYVDSIIENLEGSARIGKLVYRARWIDFESKDEDILAYTNKNSHSLLVDDCYIVLYLGGEIEIMSEDDFHALLAQQQSQDEIEMLKSGL